MLLTLIKTRETRYGVHAVLIETNHIFGDKHLAEKMVENFCNQSLQQFIDYKRKYEKQNNHIIKA